MVYCPSLRLALHNIPPADWLRIGRRNFADRLSQVTGRQNPVLVRELSPILTQLTEKSIDPRQSYRYPKVLFLLRISLVLPPECWWLLLRIEEEESVVILVSGVCQCQCHSHRCSHSLHQVRHCELWARAQSVVVIVKWSWEPCLRVLMISADIVSFDPVLASKAILPSCNRMNLNVSPNPLGTVYATKRRRRSNKR